jgi:hypothetical protein
MVGQLSARGTANKIMFDVHLLLVVDLGSQRGFASISMMPL